MKLTVLSPVSSGFLRIDFYGASTVKANFGLEKTDLLNLNLK